MGRHHPNRSGSLVPIIEEPKALNEDLLKQKTISGSNGSSRPSTKRKVLKVDTGKIFNQRQQSIQSKGEQVNTFGNNDSNTDLLQALNDANHLTVQRPQLVQHRLISPQQDKYSAFVSPDFRVKHKLSIDSNKEGNDDPHFYVRPDKKHSANALID